MCELIRRIGLLVHTKEEEKCKNYIRSSFGTYASYVYDEGNQIQEYELGGSCSSHGVREKCVKNFRLNFWRLDLSVDRWIILKQILQKLTVNVLVELACLMIWCVARLLWTQQYNIFALRARYDTCWITEPLSLLRFVSWLVIRWWNYLT